MKRAVAAGVPVRRWVSVSTLVVGLAISGFTPAEMPPVPAPSRDTPPIERLDDGTYRVEQMRVEQAARRVIVSGVVNSTTVLEYLANARRGFKAYESALELDASATAFNLAMILIGLGGEKAVSPKSKFEPDPPEGDLVEIWIEWSTPDGPKRIRAEELIYDSQRGRTLEPGPWVYTGSVFLEDGTYLAQANGVLIGFMHTPESIVDSSLRLESSYGSHHVNPELGLAPGTPVTVIVTALAREGE